MKRLLAGLVGLYLLAALVTRVAEAMGMRNCGSQTPSLSDAAKDSFTP